MIRWQWAEHYDGFGTEYQFKLIGDQLPRHRHEPEDGHTTRCLRGRAWLLFDDNTGIEFTPAHGEITFDVTRVHTVVALCDGAIVFHKIKDRPPDWRELLGTGGEVDG